MCSRFLETGQKTLSSVTFFIGKLQLYASYFDKLHAMGKKKKKETRILDFTWTKKTRKSRPPGGLEK
jgi:hypothetical protein